MNETHKLFKNFLVSSILTILTAILFCGIFIAQNETSKMLFG